MKVLVMVSVIDSLGAITNASALLKVGFKYPSSLESQIGFYWGFFESSVRLESDVSARIRSLSLLGIELIQLVNSGVYSKSEVSQNR